MLDRGYPAKIDHQSLKGLDTSPFPVGEINGFSQSAAAAATALLMAVKDDELRPSTHGQSMKGPLKSAFHGQVGPIGSASGASPLVFLFHDVQVNGSASELGFQVMVACQTESMIKITCRGHGRSPLV
jgi:hypothetical protein